MTPANRIEIMLNFTGNAEDYEEFKGVLQEIFERNTLVEKWTILAMPVLPPITPTSDT